MEPDWTHERTIDLSIPGNRAITLWNAMLCASYKLLDNQQGNVAADTEFLTDMLYILTDLYTGSKDAVSIHDLWHADVQELFVRIYQWSYANRNSVDRATARNLGRAWDALSDAIKDNGGNNGE
jgi:hypothetical protein